MKNMLQILAVLGALVLIGCGNTGSASRLPSVAELIAKDNAELTPEQSDAKKTLFNIIKQYVAADNEQLVLNISRKDFVAQGLPASYYKALKKSLRDSNRFIRKSRREHPDMKFDLEQLHNDAIKNIIEAFPEYN